MLEWAVRLYNHAALSRQVRCALLLLILAVAGCRHAQDMKRPATQENFGVQMARASLWREAMFRFRRAVELDPSSAVAHNNLAVAFEANGDFDNAAKEYREALRLDRSNQYIQKNYSRFVEFLSRNRKRQQQQRQAAGKDAAPATATAPEGGAQATPVTSTAPASPPAPAPAAATTPPAVAPTPTPNPPQGGSR
jgi:Tfp pilus assembly protein PilF